ncbi:unnamed protein product [Rotaria socialis]|uniref:Uncharacterized protein n=1 Tax=Rotaria socialis TaxID=392032 RepID=A0A817TYI9_9BILA|nr:unnamed protein product [Rotaria socialis]CAF3494730.1 unnamed protein product [Rotaria socialis]
MRSCRLKLTTTSHNHILIALDATTTPLQPAPHMSEQLPIYDHGCSSILVSQLPEIQMIGNAIQTLYSEQVENLSNVAYDAVPDQCNWNDTGIKLFENNENLYDPFNPSIELVHQPHASSRLNQSSTTISDRSANITTDNSRNSCFEVVTNVISNFLTPSFLSPSKK